MKLDGLFSLYILRMLSITKVSQVSQSAKKLGSYYSFFIIQDPEVFIKMFIVSENT